MKMGEKYKILKEETVFNDYLVVKDALIEHEIKEGEFTRYTRKKIDSYDAVSILMYNRSNDSIVLVKQFRYPIFEKTKKNKDAGYLLEVVAGKIDKGETPKATAVREVFEETGYVIKESELIGLSNGFPSPGCASTRVFNYAVVVTNNHKKGKGGGKEEEFEDIEVIHMPYMMFRSLVESGSISDFKTRLLYYEASKEGIFNIKKEPVKLKKPIKNNQNNSQISMF
jgi:GDP-mannose pyrophosphatase NudK